MTDLDRKILAKACGLCWHECDLVSSDRAKCRQCGEYFNVEDTFLEMSLDYNSSFSTPDDWELVRVKVVVPNSYQIVIHLRMLWMGTSLPSLEQWLLKTPEECCQSIVNWIKSTPDLFPWVVEMKGE